MASKDQAIGGLICLVCVLVAVLYVLTLFVPDWLSRIGLMNYTFDRLWLIAVPVLIALVAILAIGAWIGWTMATTPPPKPIEEITTEIEDKKEEAKAAVEKTEEAVRETAEEVKKAKRKS